MNIKEAKFLATVKKALRPLQTNKKIIEINLLIKNTLLLLSDNLLNTLIGLKTI